MMRILPRMKPLSIRKFLFLNLILALAVAFMLTVLGDYHARNSDILSQMDAQLMHKAFELRALLPNDLAEGTVKQTLQVHLNRLAERELTLVPYLDIKQSHRDFYQSVFASEFQVLGQSGDVLLHSVHAPVSLSAFKGKTQFGTIASDKKEDWRVFALYDSQAKRSIIVAKQMDNERFLSRQILFDDLRILFWIYPLSGLLIWLIIGRGLSALTLIAEQIRDRKPDYLELVELDKLPKELHPIIGELNKLFLRLRQTIEREKRFAGDAAHELRTPLAALKTQVQVALHVKDEAERVPLLKNIIASVNRSSHVVQQLLILSRLMPEAGVLDNVTRVVLPKLAAEIIAQIAPQAFEKDIELSLDAESDTISVLGNMTSLGILMRNLLDNAIRYTPEEGKVETLIVTDAHTVRLIVCDDGQGIPIELRERVFERFYRVIGNKQTGSGLGLAIVQQIATMHQAEVKLSTPPSGKGLQIEVIFPIPAESSLKVKT